MSAVQMKSDFLRRYQSRVFLRLMRGVLRQRGATFTVLFPRQAGKNELSATLVSALLLMHAGEGGSVVVCAPTYRPQARISQERTMRALRQAALVVPKAGQPSERENEIQVGQARAIFLSASPEAHSPGHTASLALIGDEAQDIDADWFDRQFRPMAASTGACTVLFGTPWDGHSLLDREVARNRAHDRTRKRGESRRHFEVSWREVETSRPVYGEYVRAERARMGADNPLFLSQYELRTIDSAGRLLSPAMLDGLRGAHSRLVAPRPGERYVGGLDIGGDGTRADRSVLSIGRVAEGRRLEVVQQVSWQGAPFARMSAEVEALVQRWGLVRLSIDGTGMGAILAASLEQQHPRVAERVHFTSLVKSDLGYGLQAAAETGRLRIYADDGSEEARLTWAELRACEARYGSGRTLQWGDDRGHDDFAVSLALCLRAAENLPIERVVRGRSPG